MAKAIANEGGSPRSAVKLERDSKFGASESVRNNNEILHQYLEWQGNVGTGYLEESRKALTRPALISHQIDENSISRVYIRNVVSKWFFLVFFVFLEIIYSVQKRYDFFSPYFESFLSIYKYINIYCNIYFDPFSQRLFHHFYFFLKKRSDFWIHLNGWQHYIRQNTCSTTTWKPTISRNLDFWQISVKPVAVLRSNRTNLKICISINTEEHFKSRVSLFLPVDFIWKTER